MKKLFVIFLLATICTMQGFAQTVWNGTASYTWYTSNDGSSPYEIATPEDFAGFSNIVNGSDGQVTDDFAGKTVILTADIYMNTADFETDLGNALQFTPIGHNNATAWDTPPTKYFAGTFNGNYHYIYNVYIKKALNPNKPSAMNWEKYYAQAGLFGATNGTVNLQNIILKNLYLEGGGTIGSLIGFCQGNVTMTNCMSINFTFYSSAISDYKMSRAGGLLGAKNASSTLTMNNCGATGGNILPDWGGALAGQMRGASTISNCYFYGTFSEGRIGANDGGQRNWSNNYAGNTNTSTSSNDWTGTTYWLGTATAQANMQNNAGFVTQLGAGWRMDVDNVNNGFPVVLNLDADCSPVTGLHATTITSNTIDIEWTAPSPAPSSYNVIWGTTGFAPANGDSDPNYIGSSSTLTPSFSLTNLEETTGYVIAVQSDCGANMLGTWIVLTAGTMAVETYGDGIWQGYVYAQTANTMKTFGNYLGYVEEQPQFNRQCGTGAWTGTNPDWITAPGPSDNFSVRYKMTKNFDCGNYIFTINADEYWRLSVDGGQTWLPSHQGTTQAGADHWTTTCCVAWQTDAIPLNGTCNLVLEFTEGSNNAYLTVSWAEVPVTITSIVGPYSAELTFSNGTNWDIKVSSTPLANPAVGVADILTTNTGTNPYLLTNLSPTITYYVYVLPTNCGTASWGSHTFTTPILCAAPSNISASDIGTASANIEWTAPLNASSFNIEWGQQGSFTPGTNNAPNSGVPTTNSYPITTGLALATAYTVAIQNVCGGAEGSSTWATYDFTTEICEPSEQCTYTLTLGLNGGAPDNYWEGTRIDIRQNNMLVFTTGLMSSVANGTVYTFTLCKNLNTEITVPQTGIPYGKWTNWQFKSTSGATIAEKPEMGMEMTGTPVFAVGNDCEPCFAPVVTSSDIGETSFKVAFSLGTSWNIKISTTPLANPITDIADVANITGITNNPYTVQSLTPATTYYVYVQSACGSNWVLKEVNTLASCPAVANLSVSQITPNSAHFTWNAPADGSADSYIIEYGPAATFTPGTNTYTSTFTTTNTHYDLSSLTQAAAYKFSVRSNCGSGSVSVWQTVSFNTTTVETFGNGIWHGYVYQSPEPDAWQNRFETYLGYVEEAAQFTKSNTIDPWTGSNANTTWVNGTAGPSDYFAVRYKMIYDFPCGNYSLTLPNVDDAARLSIDSGVTWLTNLCTGSNCGSAGNWEINSGYHNGTYTANNIYLSGETNLVLEFFEANSGASVGFQFTEQPIVITASELAAGSMNLTFSGGTEWNIKVSVDQLDDPATDPADFVFNNITANPYSLTGLTPETTYYIYVRLACGNTWSSTTATTVSTCPVPSGLTAVSSDNGAALSWLKLGITGWNLKVSTTVLTDPDNQQGVVFDQWVDTNHYQITGLTNNMTYYWYVQSDCGSGWANGQFTTKTAGTDCNSPIVINQADIPYAGSGTTVDMGNEYSNTAMGTFDDNNDVLYQITLTQPMTLDFKVSSCPVYATMGLFNGCPDAGTLIVTKYRGFYEDTLIITQPLLPGVYYLMLDKFTYNSVTTYNYNLTIGCATPTLTVTNINTTDAQVNITSYTNEFYLKVSSMPINPATTDGNIMAGNFITGNSYSLTGLSSSSDYYVYARTNCSPWASTTFTTFATCQQPSDLAVANTNHNSTEFTFTGATATQYDIEWGIQGFIPGTNDEEASGVVINPATELPYIITSLSEATKYTVAVRSDCGSGDVSGWKMINFRTSAEETYGNGIWHGYVYSAPNSKDFNDYLGYVEEQAQFSRNYTTQNAVWSGENEVWLDPAPANNFSARYRMTYNFTGNNYVFNIEADDYFRLSVDGGATWLPFTRDNTTWTNADGNFWTTACCSPSWHSDTIAINGVNNLVLEFAEGTGGTYLNFSFMNLDCQAPADIAATGITTTGAEISWTGNSNAVNYTMEVCAPGVTLGNGDIYANVASPVSISGLMGSTAYTVYIKSNCSSSESPYTGYTFNTACDAVPDSQIGFTEEAGWTGTSIPPTAAVGTFTAFKGSGDCNGSAPACWDVNATCLYGTAGGNYPRAELGDNTRYMIMPPLDSDVPMANLKMKIWIRSDNASRGLKIFATNGNNLTGIELLTTIDGGQSTSFPTGELYVMREVDLGAFYATTGAAGKRIGFTPSVNYRVDIYKVVIWQELPPTCPAPVAVTITGITDNSATVSWTAGGSETEWAVQYRQQGTPSWTAVSPNPTTASCNLTGLIGQNTYEIQVKAICSPIDESIWTPTVNFTTPCASIGIPHTESFPDPTPAFPACWSAYRDNVFSTNGITTDVFMANSSSGCVTRSLRLYANYLNGILISPPLAVDANLLEVTYCSRRENNSSPVGTVSVGYLADLNDPTSFVAIETYSTNTHYPAAYAGYNFTVDLSSVPAGITHVAFKHATNGIIGTAGWIWLDEIKFDYPAAPCATPTALTHNTVTHNSANITWTAGDNETTWHLVWKEASASTWSVPAVANSTTFSLTGLTAQTCYDVRVKAICSSGNESDWSTIDNFCTSSIPPCNAPAALTTQITTYNSITITWLPANAENKWKVSWKDLSTGFSTSSEANNNDYSGYLITGLTDSTEYRICVVAVCDQGMESDSTCVNAITRHEVGIHNIVLANSLQLYPNPTTGELRIENYELREGDKIEIYNMLGQKQPLTTNNYPLTTINVSHLSAGIYTLKIGGYVGKFVKR
jgi:hypothetical protein